MPRSPAYFDTSVVVKRYILEIGTARARALLRRHRVVSSAITAVETMGAMCRRRRGGELTADDFAAIVTRLQKDRALWEVIGVSPTVLADAEAILRDTGVRTLDAVHLASARAARILSAKPLPFVTADVRQRAAAEQLGLDMVWVE